MTIAYHLHLLINFINHLHILLAAHRSLHLKHVRRFLLLNESQRPPYSPSHASLFGHSARYSPSRCRAGLCSSVRQQQILSTSLQSVPPAAMTIARPSYGNSFLPSDPICLFADITSQVHDFQTPPIMYLKHSSLRK